MFNCFRLKGNGETGINTDTPSWIIHSTGKQFSKVLFQRLITCNCGPWLKQSCCLMLNPVFCDCVFCFFWELCSQGAHSEMFNRRDAFLCIFFSFFRNLCIFLCEKKIYVYGKLQRMRANLWKRHSGGFLCQLATFRGNRNYLNTEHLTLPENKRKPNSSNRKQTVPSGMRHREPLRIVLVEGGVKGGGRLQWVLWFLPKDRFTSCLPELEKKSELIW